MVSRVIVLAALAYMLFTAGCCATGADDTLFTQQKTQLNLPGQ